MILVRRPRYAPIKTKLRFTTMIELPKNEQILEFICGDKEFWVVNGAQNFAFVKPAKQGSETNLNLITAAGNVYSFVLQEGKEGRPDLKVFVESRDKGFVRRPTAPPGLCRRVRSTTTASSSRWRRMPPERLPSAAKAEIAKAKEQAQRARRMRRSPGIRRP